MPEPDISRKTLIESVLEIVPSFTYEQVDSAQFSQCLSVASMMIVEHGLFGHNQLAHHARMVQQGLRQLSRDGGIQ